MTLSVVDIPGSYAIRAAVGANGAAAAPMPAYVLRSD
jgi:hypothetical protein